MANQRKQFCPKGVMISEKELRKEIKITKDFIKSLKKNHKELSWDEIYGYLDGLEYCLNGKLQ